MTTQTSPQTAEQIEAVLVAVADYLAISRAAADALTLTDYLAREEEAWERLLAALERRDEVRWRPQCGPVEAAGLLMAERAT